MLPQSSSPLLKGTKAIKSLKTTKMKVTKKNSRIIYPLAVYVIWHPNFKAGKVIANELYSTFCRDTNKPLERGLGIPVFFRYLQTSNSDMPIKIEKNNASKNALILLIDYEIFIDLGFRKYIEELTKLIDKDTRIFPVALCKEAAEIGCGISKKQFIKAFKGDTPVNRSIDYTKKTIKTSVLNDCARLMVNMQPSWEDKEEDRTPSPVKLFLSHAKKDGLDIVKRFKYFVLNELKLDVFFDAIDIADGYDFDKQIKTNIINSAILVFLTDAYSSREWCRIEALIAKRHKCPLVLIHCIKHGEVRSFPYLGNIPTITIPSEKVEEYHKVTNLILLQVINNKYQNELLKGFQEKYLSKKAIYERLASPPELLNYIDIYKLKKQTKSKVIVLYPEPPLGIEELELLNEIDDTIIYLTPIQISSNI